MITNEDIAKRAYEIWEKAGKPEGKAQENWLEAEAHLTRRDGGHPLKETAAQELLKTPKPRKAFAQTSRV